MYTTFKNDIEKSRHIRKIMYNDDLCENIKPDILKNVDETKYINYISKNIIKNILEKKFYNPVEMKKIISILCGIINNSKAYKKNGIEFLKKNMKWMRKFDLLSNNSVQGDVYKTKILDFKVILKTPKKDYMILDVIEEYYKGMYFYNNIRFKIPTMLYTLGIFNCNLSKTKKCNELSNNNKLFVMYEEIVGKTMESYIIDNISFDEWLKLFFQILLTLEVAQRECNFTHYDLHNNNIMIRKVNMKYDVNIDNKIYSINTKILPVIIDYGHSSLKTPDNVVIGQFGFESYGIFPFMVQGRDMYHILTFCAMSFIERTKKETKILELYEFFGQNDPYKIIKKKEGGVLKARKEYIGRFSSSECANYTPKMFMTWILNKPKYAKILKDTVTIKNRQVYKELFINNSLYFPDNLIDTKKLLKKMFNEKDNIKKILNIISSCFKFNNSYIYIKYNLNLLEKLNYKTNKISKELEKYKEDFINNDLNQLNKILTKKIPKDYIKILNKFSDIILDTHLHNKKRKITKNIKDFNKNKNSVYNIFEYLEKYLETYYIILELELEEYKDWVKKFEGSYIYNIYFTYIDKVNRVRRWESTLILYNNYKYT